MSRFASFLAAAATAALLIAGPAAAGTSRVAHRVASVARNSPPPPYGWPQLLRDPSHSSVAPDTLINTSSAPQLGINWMSALRSADLGSPVSVYNKTLGKVVVYIGDERGDVTAYDQQNGATLWTTSIGFGDSMRATPLVAPDGTVWVATSYGSTLYKLDGATGAVDCSIKEKIRFNASPMFATPPGGIPTVYISTNDAGTVSGVTAAINESNCKTIWNFNQFVTYAGAWATAAYGVDTTGRGLVIVGTADPDSTLYAIDAVTGKRVWYFKILNPPPYTYDIGAAATVSAPGVNGFVDGAVYVPSKYGIMYALNLRTGKELWEYNFNKDANTVEGGRSSAALSGKSLVFGMANGIYSLDATTGAKLWHYIDPPQQEVISSPAILGPSGGQVVGFGDVTGAVRFVRLSDGTNLYNYQTGNYITSSPAVIQGHFIIDSTDGFLYDFAVGGGNVAPGTTAITSPSTGSKVVNPQGNLTVTGTSTDNAGVTEVIASVQAGGPTGSWYDSATNSWVKGAYNNFVAVQSPGQTQSNWSFQFPVPSSGSSYQVFVNTVDLQGQVDRVGAQSSFTVMPNTNLPQLQLSAAIAAPGSSFIAKGTGFVAGEGVGFSLQGVAVAKATADSNGNVPGTKIVVPATAAFGPSALVATGQANNVSTSAPIDVTNVWADSGFGAARSGYEPNDTVLAKTLQATHSGYVARAWLFSAGAPVNSSPAVYAGSAYVGDDAGQFYAIDNASGAPFWTYTTPTGKPIHGSPAVDGSVVAFGSDDGTLYTLACGTGALVGTSALDGIPSAPAIAGGAIYVATDAGSVYEINETTGAVVWRTSVGAAIHSSPSVDGAANLVAIGDDSGAVTTLNAKTGAKLSSIKTGGAVTASPAIIGGDIVIGSSDGTLYVYNEKTGALRYTYAEGAPIHAIAATGAYVYVGGDDGSLSYLTQSTGAKIFKLSFGTSPVVGIAATVDVPFVETADGNVGAIKDDQARILYNYKTSGPLATAPAIVDGAVYVGAADGSLYAFTSYGLAPVDAKQHRLLMSLRKKLVTPARWTAPATHYRADTSSHAFGPAGPRDFAIHLDRAIAAAPAAAMQWNGGPVQRSPRSYLIYWAPNGSANSAEFATASSALRSGAISAGTAVDTSPYPRLLDDGAVQHEIARQVAANRWNVDVNSQVFVVTGMAATASANGYCAYHSAFDLGGRLASPLPYAFVPHPDAASHCGALAPIVIREQAQMRMDPLLNGWHDARGNEPTK